jgi:hypothetical protein
MVKSTLLRMAALLGVSTLLGACGYVSAYEEGVYEYEPTYCYQSLGGVSCHTEPNHRDERRLVNYYGPHPSRYDAPEPPEAMELQAPPEIDYFVKDPEPIPQPNLSKAPAPLPWNTAKADSGTNDGAEDDVNASDDTSESNVESEDEE